MSSDRKKPQHELRNIEDQESEIPKIEVGHIYQLNKDPLGMDQSRTALVKKIDTQGNLHIEIQGVADEYKIRVIRSNEIPAYVGNEVAETSPQESEVVQRIVDKFYRTIKRALFDRGRYREQDVEHIEERIGEEVPEVNLDKLHKEVEAQELETAEKVDISGFETQYIKARDRFINIDFRGDVRQNQAHQLLERIHSSLDNFDQASDPQQEFDRIQQMYTSLNAVLHEAEQIMQADDDLQVLHQENESFKQKLLDDGISLGGDVNLKILQNIDNLIDNTRQTIEQVKGKIRLVPSNIQNNIQQASQELASLKQNLGLESKEIPSIKLDTLESIFSRAQDIDGLINALNEQGLKSVEAHSDISLADIVSELNAIKGSIETSLNAVDYPDYQDILNKHLKSFTDKFPQLAETFSNILSPILDKYIYLAPEYQTDLWNRFNSYDARFAAIEVQTGKKFTQGRKLQRSIHELIIPLNDSIRDKQWYKTKQRAEDKMLELESLLSEAELSTRLKGTQGKISQLSISIDAQIGEKHPGEHDVLRARWRKLWDRFQNLTNLPETGEIQTELVAINREIVRIQQEIDDFVNQHPELKIEKSSPEINLIGDDTLEQEKILDKEAREVKLKCELHGKVFVNDQIYWINGRIGRFSQSGSTAGKYRFIDAQGREFFIDPQDERFAGGVVIHDLDTFEYDGDDIYWVDMHFQLIDGYDYPIKGVGGYIFRKDLSRGLDHAVFEKDGEYYIYQISQEGKVTLKEKQPIRGESKPKPETEVRSLSLLEVESALDITFEQGESYSLGGKTWIYRGFPIDLTGQSNKIRFEEPKTSQIVEYDAQQFVDRYKGKIQRVEARQTEKEPKLSNKKSVHDKLIEDFEQEIGDQDLSENQQKEVWQKILGGLDKDNLYKVRTLQLLRKWEKTDKTKYTGNHRVRQLGEALRQITFSFIDINGVQIIIGDRVPLGTDKKSTADYIYDCRDENGKYCFCKARAKEKSK